MQAANTRHYVAIEEDGWRLDYFLGAKYGLGRRRAGQLCAERKVLVDGVPTPGGRKLQRGQQVSVLEENLDFFYPALVPEEADLFKRLCVLLENEQLVVCSKPRGMHSVRLGNERELTLVDCLRSLYFTEGKSQSGVSKYEREAGLLQRLDYYTSGLVLQARSAQAWSEWRQELKRETISKYYLALVEAVPKQQVLEMNSPVVVRPNSVRVYDRVCSSRDRLYPAKSVIYFLRAVTPLVSGQKDSALVLVEGRTMKRHQVRYHCAEAGYPLVGDSTYGAKTELMDYFPGVIEQEAEVGLLRGDRRPGGFLLHAYGLRFSGRLFGGLGLVSSQDRSRLNWSESYIADKAPFLTTILASRGLDLWGDLAEWEKNRGSPW